MSGHEPVHGFWFSDHDHGIGCHRDQKRLTGWARFAGASGFIRHVVRHWFVSLFVTEDQRPVLAQPVLESTARNVFRNTRISHLIMGVARISEFFPRTYYWFRRCSGKHDE